MNYKEQAKEVQDKIFAGQLLEAFEQYYAEDVEMHEIGHEPRKGKAANREYEQNFLNSVSEFHGGGVTHIAFDDQHEVAMIESWMDVTFKEQGRVKMSQVSVQEWKDGKVVKERFYHT